MHQPPLGQDSSKVQLNWTPSQKETSFSFSDRDMMVAA